MSEAERIEDLARRGFEGEAWHGQSLSELLSDVDAEKASAKIIADAHSIWEIVLHITSWQRIARRRVNGLSDGGEVPDSEDWPPATDVSPLAWEGAKAALARENVRLRETIAGLDDHRLEEQVRGHAYSVYALLHGVIQHDLYHAGQIALLKKEAP